jgi:hypothetical protein
VADGDTNPACAVTQTELPPRTCCGASFVQYAMAVLQTAGTAGRTGATNAQCLLHFGYGWARDLRPVCAMIDPVADESDFVGRECFAAHRHVGLIADPAIR